MSARPRRRERGSIMIEFVLIASLFLVPLIIGVFTYGFAIIQSVEAVELTSDVGHMYSEGVDFSTQANQNLLSTNLAQGLNIVANTGNVTGGTSGNGVVVLSTLTYLTNASCNNCSNAGHVVVMNRIVIGNNSIFTTSYGNPNPTLITTNGDVTNYDTDPTAQADTFSNLMTLNAGQIAYMAESYITAPQLAVPGVFSGLATYQNAIY